MNEKEILLAFLAATLNLPTESVAEVLYKKSDDGTEEVLQENALDALKTLDKERVAKLKPDTKVFFDNGYKKAQAEVSAKYENLIREKTGVQTDEVGEDLIVAAISHIAKPNKLDDEKVKTHPIFLQHEKTWKEKLENETKERESAIEAMKSEYKREQLTQSAQNAAKQILLDMKPVLEDDPKIANKRIQYFLNEFKQFEYEALEDGTLIPIKGGKRVETDHGHAKSFEQIAKDLAAESFKFQVQDPKGNGGNKNEPGKDGHQPGKAPKTEEELWQAVNAAPQEQRKAIMEAWEKEYGEIAV